MEQNPMKYTRKNLYLLMNRPIKLSVGPPNKDEVNEVVEGIIIKCDLAANLPHLPANAEIKLENGNVKKYSFAEMKRIEFL
ncbi:hypothetical protein [Maribacter sp. 4G9]|uniref:hypothetical protein n=1 Tax=Maribacter sp. 4G9 TaxID=1889777 RepID=UPI000C160232|nr:hypothetical protein [Maribacter sp. 4G9]PIB28270.1 hypothetical protein BFP75_06080 [Maribacter sp. 4G9]